MVSTPSSMVTLVSWSQPLKASSPMVFTLPGMVTSVRPVSSKARSPMLVRLSGSVTPTRLESVPWEVLEPLKASSGKALLGRVALLRSRVILASGLAAMAARRAYTSLSVSVVSISTVWGPGPSDEM